MSRSDFGRQGEAREKGVKRCPERSSRSLGDGGDCTKCRVDRDQQLGRDGFPGEMEPNFAVLCCRGLWLSRRAEPNEAFVARVE